MYNGKIVKNIKYIDARSKVIYFYLTEDAKNYIGKPIDLEGMYNDFMMKQGGFNDSNPYYSHFRSSDEEIAKLLNLNFDEIKLYNEKIEDIRATLHEAVEQIVLQMFNKQPEEYSLSVDFTKDKSIASVLLYRAALNKDQLEELAEFLVENI